MPWIKQHEAHIFCIIKCLEQLLSRKTDNEAVFCATF